MTRPSEKTGSSLLSAMKSAQQLAFGPLLFQAALELRRRGILRHLIEAGPRGLEKARLVELSATSAYGVTVLLEAGLALDLVQLDDGRFTATRVGYLVERDPMTRANMDFTADVCARPALHLAACLDEGRAVGLSELGPWPTVYEGLSEMSEPARTSWFAFDHFYSDDSFPLVLKDVLAKNPERLLDVGGNTGKFATAFLNATSKATITIADLPGQARVAEKNLREAGWGERVRIHEVDLLGPDPELPGGHDVVWMSQFLCCFSEAEVVKILSLAKKSLARDGTLFIMDNFWDRQKNEVASLCLQATSLYFTCVANGNSRMYDASTMKSLIVEAGLSVRSERDQIGFGHTLFECAVRV